MQKKKDKELATAKVVNKAKHKHEDALVGQVKAEDQLAVSRFSLLPSPRSTHTHRGG